MPTLEEIEEEQRQSLLGLLNRTDTPALPVNKNNMTEVIEPDSKRKVSMPAGSSMGIAKETLKLQDSPQATSDDWRNADGLINQFSSFIHKPGGLGDPLDVIKALKDGLVMDAMNTSSNFLLQGADRIEFHEQMTASGRKAVDEAETPIGKALEFGKVLATGTSTIEPILKTMNVHNKMRAYNKSVDKSIANYIMENDMDDPENQTIAQGFGEVFYSIAKFLSLASTPAGPLAAGGVFGTQQQMDGYKARRDKGFSVHDSVNGAIPEGAITTVASTIGGGMLQKAVGGTTKTVAGAIVLGGAGESIDEAVEGGLIDILRQYEGVHDISTEDFLRNRTGEVLFSFGAGGSTGGVGKLKTDRKIKSTLGRATS